MDKIESVFLRSEAKGWPVKLEKVLRWAWQNSKLDLVITIEEHKETRRTKQNRLLFLWHNELAKHIEKHQGQVFDSEDIHEHVSGKLLPKRVVCIDESDPQIMRTKTSKLKVAEFANFLTRYEMWANDVYQCVFSRPDDLYLAAVMAQGENNG